VVNGDVGCEAYTAIAWGVGLSHEKLDIAAAEGFHSLEGNMCGTAMRGADALPGSKANDPFDVLACETICILIGYSCHATAAPAA
jgi:hypothetical protein